MLSSIFSRHVATQVKQSSNLIADRMNYFGINNLFDVENLINARVHLGHKQTLLNGHMRPYIFGNRLGVSIIDLNKTEKLLKYALLVTAEIALRRGIILFAHGPRPNRYLVEQAAQDCGEYAYCRRWKNEVFTNSTQVFGSVTRLPDLVIFFSTLDGVKEHKGIVMSAKMMIPTVAICDTNSDPSLITYPVPGNDDTAESLELYCNLFKTVIMNAKSKI